MNVISSANMDTIFELFPGVDMDYMAGVPDNVTVRKCSFCRQSGHSILSCRGAKCHGQQLHLTGIRIKEIDIENNRNGMRVKEWIHSLSYRDVKIISRRNNLQAYAHDLWSRNIIDVTKTIFNNRSDYLEILYYFYYLEAQLLNDEYNKKKFNIVTFDICSLVDKYDDCPICLESQSSSERIDLNCNHSVCKSCFDKCLDHAENRSPVMCSLCRLEITTASFTSMDNKMEIKQKYIMK
jgi:hypothetical protein